MSEKQIGQLDAPQPAQNQALRKQVGAAVDQWYADQMHNTVVSRDTAVHNHIHAAKQSLIDAVVNAIKTKE